MSLSTIATAETYAAALSRLTGTEVVPRHSENYSEVLFADPDGTKTWLEKQLQPGKPGDVRIEFGPVVYPVVIKKILPYAIGVLVIGFLLGKIS